MKNNKRRYRFGWSFFENKSVAELLYLGYSREVLINWVLNSSEKK